MLESGNKGEAQKKAYETAYAIFRMTSKMVEREIAEELKKAALQTLVAVLEGNNEKAQASLGILDYLIKFGTDLNFMSFSNGEVLMKEIGNLQVMIAEFVHAATEADKADDLDASLFFSKQAEVVSEPVSDRFRKNENDFGEANVSSEKKEETNRVSVNVAELEPVQAKASSTNSFLKSGMRQIAILDKIRQSGNCRMRDLQEILPDSSERTIRYDLEELTERKLIERVGNGGPSLYYRVRQS